MSRRRDSPSSRHPKGFAVKLSRYRDSSPPPGPQKSHWHCPAGGTVWTHSTRPQELLCHAGMTDPRSTPPGASMSRRRDTCRFRRSRRALGKCGVKPPNVGRFAPWPRGHGTYEIASKSTKTDTVRFGSVADGRSSTLKGLQPRGGRCWRGARIQPFQGWRVSSAGFPG